MIHHYAFRALTHTTKVAPEWVGLLCTQVRHQANALALSSRHQYMCRDEAVVRLNTFWAVLKEQHFPILFSVKAPFATRQQGIAEGLSGELQLDAWRSESQI